MAINADQLRSTFTSFFQDHAHVLVPSGPLVPQHRAAPLFTNAGMVPFLPYFLEEESAPFPRATSSQKCLRVRGKHDDIEIIGLTTRHLTFFEMLGNFSFGDYFKADAIQLAWEFLTERLELESERLWVTVYNDDDEASDLWQELVAMPVSRIQRTGEDNFWEMGTTGPCGPCSEIFYDRGPELGADGGPVGGGEERFVEIWNLVFMQSQRFADGHLEPLPKRNIDTGAGMERILPILQGTTTVFETDVLRRLIDTAESLTGASYGQDPTKDVSLRILADHSRSMTFLLSDGVMPSNEERGYVLRRIIRRAVRHARRAGADGPTLARMASAVVDTMRDGYPELVEHLQWISEAVEREEARFTDRLSVGLSLLEKAIDEDSAQLSGEAAFRLHDTHGFPIDLTKEIAAERGVAVDIAEFEAQMKRQQTLARASARKTVDEDALTALRRLQEELGDSAFTGYDEWERDAVVRYVGDDDSDDGVHYLYADATPFYAMSGGQLGDTGTITAETGTARVIDTASPLPGLIQHRIEPVDGHLEPGQTARFAVDNVRRAALRRSHTGTHLLHSALRRVLGVQTHQQGSLVAPDVLRFDFNHHSPVSRAELDAIEDLVTDEILGDGQVTTTVMPLTEARATGAMQFFGEKYGEYVRVVQAGQRSTELCGGLHVSSLGRIGAFFIRSESSVGANLRRIEAVVGLEAHTSARSDRRLIAAAATKLRTSPDQVLDAIDRADERQSEAELELQQLRHARDRTAAAELVAGAVDGVVVQRIDGRPLDELRILADLVRDKPDVFAVGLVGVAAGAVGVAVGTDDEALDAAAIARDSARILGGGAGGSARTATGGGRDVKKISEALEALREAFGTVSPSER